MKAHLSLNVTRRELNVFIACLLSFSLLMMPFVQVAAATSRGSERRVNRNKSSETPPVARLANAAQPAPAPEPFAPSITATKAGVILNDDGDNKADPAVSPNPEKIEYTVTIS